jgi:uncharacterized protein
MKHALYKPLGFLFLGLAVAGVILPMLPGTPFALLSAWFFARSSEKWHRWLLNSNLFGATLRSWEQDRCIPCKIKVVALASMLIAGTASIVFSLTDLRLQLLTAVLLAIGGGTVMMIRTCPSAVKK